MLSMTRHLQFDDLRKRFQLNFFDDVAGSLSVHHALPSNFPGGRPNLASWLCARRNM
ncbi:hypothetical protein L509_0931 [Bordetella bronchiseptica M85/00/2]|nr:hypothetical protein L509_0931 [Bordetella bronchiseptica M85/00/2]